MAGLQPSVVWLNAILITLTLFAICSRVGRRVWIVGVWSWHDVLITLAAVSACIFSIFQIVGIEYGLGLHSSEVPDSQLTILIKLVMASNVFYFLCNWAVKHALLLFYSEIVRDNKWYKGSIYFMHFVAFGFGLSSILVNIFQCRPIRKTWDADAPGWCANMNMFFRLNSIIMLTTDLVLYTMPVIFTWHLQLRRPQRIGLNALFALGGIVLAASAARVHAVHNFASHPDFPWWFAWAMIWAVLENHLAIVVACAPSVKVIAILLFPRLASSYRKVVSKVTPSSSRSRSRASHPFDTDLESGTHKSDKLKPTPSSTPLPSPAFTAESGSSRASRNFAKWFKQPQNSRGLPSADSMEESGLVYVEDMQPASKDVQLVNIPKDREKRWKDKRTTSPMPGDSDIRVEHTIEVESARDSDEDIKVVGRAV